MQVSILLLRSVFTECLTKDSFGLSLQRRAVPTVDALRE